MLNPEVSRSFNAWLDRIVAECPTDQIGAYGFLLYEHEDAFAVQMVGSARYVVSEPFALREQVFSSGEDLVELPRSVVGADWPEGLEAAKNLIASYLQKARERVRFSQTASSPSGSSMAISKSSVVPPNSTRWASEVEKC